MEKQGQSRGVALVTALLITALATIAAVAMAARLNLDIRRTGNVLQSDQAYLYALGGEGWAAQVLRKDREESEVDHLEEMWAIPLPPIPVEGGQIAGQIEDLQGRFNINNLFRGGQRSQVDVERFERLLRALQLPPELLAAVVDWLDGDPDPTFPSGAEDDTYLGEELPYRAANRSMASPSELMLVAGIDREVYLKLAPYVTALPEGSKTNVNTASVPVLMSLAEGLTEAEAETLIEGRGEEGYSTPEDFLSKNPALNGVPREGLSVGSDYFLVHVAAEIGRARYFQVSLLHRDSAGNTRTLVRARDEY